MITELPQDWRKRLLEGINNTVCPPGSKRKEQCPHKRLSGTCMCMSKSLWRKHRSTVACCRVRDTEYNSAGISPFEGSCHYRHYPYRSLPSGQTTGREHSPTHQQKIGLKIYRAWHCLSKQEPDSPTVSLSHQEASTSLLSLSIRKQIE